MTKAYEYGGPGIGSYDTRHEAIGAAAIEGREYADVRQCPFMGPKDAVGHVLAIPTAVCGYCKQAFDHQRELIEHKPCPHYEPVENHEHSNPIEAARMTRYGL